MDSTFKLIGLFILFVLIIIACYYTTKFVGGRQLGQMKSSNFKVLETFRVSQNKYMQLMRVGSKYVVIAVCKDTITVITELDEEDIISYNNEKAAGSSFKDIFNLINKKQKDESDILKAETQANTFMNHDNDSEFQKRENDN